jgi:hypothetical protein
MAEQNVAHKRILEYFTYLHLPERLQFISAPVCDTAFTMAGLLLDSKDPAEVTVGLRKLLEAKDCFVRAALKE